MKVVIVGAGEQGYVLTWNLVKHPDVTEIVLADADVERASDVVARVGAGKATAAKADARDVEQVAGLAAGGDLLINAVIPECDEALMKAALAGDVHLSRTWRRAPTGGTIDDGYQTADGHGRGLHAPSAGRRSIDTAA